MKKAIIIDIDGTISDSVDRVFKLKRSNELFPDNKNNNYKAFYQDAKYDKPLKDNINNIIRFMYNNFPSNSYSNPIIEMPLVIFLTGRPERIRKDTIN